MENFAYEPVSTSLIPNFSAFYWRVSDSAPWLPPLLFPESGFAEFPSSLTTSLFAGGVPPSEFSAGVFSAFGSYD